jgi:hypothetical protein
MENNENNENNGINNQNIEVTNIPNKINNMENSMTNPSSVVNIEENRTLNSETNTINNNEVLNNVSSVNTNNENITQNDIQNVNNNMVSSSTVNNFDSNSITPNNVQSMNNNINNAPSIDTNVNNSINNINTNNTIENHNSVPNNTNINAKQNDDFMIKKEKKIWPIILIVVILLIVGLVCGYYFIVMSPKNILNKTIDNMYSKVDKIYKSINENKNKETSLKGVTEGNLIITTKSLNINGSANYYLGYDVSDENNIKAYLETSVKYNNAEPVNGTVYLEKDIVYILIKEIYNKALGISLKSAMNDKTCNDSTQTDCIPESSIIKPNEIFKEENKLDISVDDVKHITDLIKESLKKSINYDKVTKSIKTDSGIYFETVYNFDSEEQDNVNKEIINSLKNDDKTIEILAKMYGTSKEEVKKSFDSMDASMGSVKGNSTTSTDSDLKIVLHTGLTNNKLTYFELSGKDAGLFTTINGEEITMELKESKDSKTPVISIKFDNNLFSGEINIEEKKYGENLVFPGYKITFSVKETKKDKGSEISSSFAVYLAKDLNTPEISVTFTANNKEGEEIKTFDKNNSVMTDKLTEEEANKIAENLTKLLDRLGIKLPDKEEDTM